jgi:hypothetical protein
MPHGLEQCADDMRAAKESFWQPAQPQLPPPGEVA